jgi:hypothetical protein
MSLNRYLHAGSVLDQNPDPGPDPEGQTDPKNVKQLLNFIFLSAGCYLLRAVAWTSYMAARG